MRNGLNISGVSELVHEIQAKPAEALIRFNTQAELRPDGVGVEVRTAHFGTIRMARGFELTIDGSDPAAESMTCYESPLAALGACVLITQITGYSVRAVSLTDLTVRVTGEISQPASDGLAAFPIDDLHYHIDVDCDPTVEDDMLRALSQFATCFSPNHRAFVDSATPRVSCLLRRSDGSVERLSIRIADPATPGEPTGGEATATAEARLQWQYGTQTSVTASSVTTQATHRVEPSFTIDQPKQMVGVDKGPNPQETLLAAVSGDVLRRLQSLAATRGLALGNPTIRGRGQLDMRGMLNVSKDSPARFHDLSFEIGLDSAAPAAEVQQLVAQAAESSAILRTLQVPRTIAVHLYRQGRPIYDFDASTKQAEAHLEAMARQQAAAAAQASE